MKLSKLATLFLSAQSVAAAGEYVQLLNGSTTTSPFTSQIDALVQNALKFYKVPGVAVAILGPNSTYAKGYGIARFPNVSVTPETLFYTGSTTKAFTAAALSLLVDNANTTKVNWTTPLRDILGDDFTFADDYAAGHLTVEDAASHRTGLPENSILTTLRKLSPKDVGRIYKYLPVTAPLRTVFQYCNLMYVTLGYVVEKVSGMALGDFLKKNIYTPLNMTSTYFSESDAVAGGKPFATGYFYLPANDSYSVAPPGIYNEYFGGGGRTISNVIDYSKWIRMMMTGGLPLSATGHAELINPRTIVSPTLGKSFITYALGWIRYEVAGYAVITHDGIVPGYAAQALYIPELQYGIVLTANSRDGADMTEALKWAFADTLVQTPLAQRTNYTQQYLTSLANKELSRNKTLVISQYFPNVTIVPAALPIDAYAGNYSNGAYGVATVTNQNGTLYFGLGDGNPLRLNLKLNHISAELFLAEGTLNTDPAYPAWIPGGFLVNGTGSAGKSIGLGIVLDPAYAENPLQFVRV